MKETFLNLGKQVLDYVKANKVAFTYGFLTGFIIAAILL